MDKKSRVILMICAAVMVLIVLLVTVFSASCGDRPQSPVTETEPETTVPESSAPSAAERTMTLSFIGDCVIASEVSSTSPDNFNYYANNRDHKYFFDGVRDILSKDDLTFANVECVLSDRSLEKAYKDYSPAFWFKGPSSYADIMRLGSVEVTGVVNNHTKDYGLEGYNDTVKSLSAEGISVGEDCVPLYREVKGVRLGVVYAHLWGSSHLSYIKDALGDMQGKCDYRIVFFHGGEEGTHEPDNYKIECCRELASEGLCDLIVGSHPHVLQPMEIVNGVPIVYSLGNFCYAGSYYPENKTVILQVHLSVNDKGEINTATRLIPCYVYTGSYNNWQPKVITDKADSDAILELMNRPVNYRTSTEPATRTEASTAAQIIEIEPPYIPEETCAYVTDETERAESDTVVVEY